MTSSHVNNISESLNLSLSLSPSVFFQVNYNIHISGKNPRILVYFKLNMILEKYKITTNYGICFCVLMAVNSGIIDESEHLVSLITDSTLHRKV